MVILFLSLKILFVGSRTWKDLENLSKTYSRSPNRICAAFGAFGNRDESRTAIKLDVFSSAA